MEKHPFATALLDVTFPEPPEENSPLYTLPNVILSPHIAGSIGNEVSRMGEYMTEEFLRVQKGEKPLYEGKARNAQNNGLIKDLITRRE